MNKTKSKTTKPVCRSQVREAVRVQPLVSTRDVTISVTDDELTKVKQRLELIGTMANIGMDEVRAEAQLAFKVLRAAGAC